VDVQAKHGGDILHDAVIYHPHCAALPFRVHTFFGWLEQKPDLAFQPNLLQEHGCAQQAGGVDIMAAGVHHARDLGSVFDVVKLLDWERVHVSSQRNDRASAPKMAHNPGPADFNLVANALGLQRASYQGSGAKFFKAQLGIPMNSPAKLDQFWRQFSCT
jgi:hypothetical protein